jgi:hypothetical protein
LFTKSDLKPKIKDVNNAIDFTFYDKLDFENSIIATAESM